MSPKWKSSSIRKLAKKHSNSQHTSGNEFILPNVSGDHVRSIKRAAPVNGIDLVNKDYVDTKDVESFPTSLSVGSVVFVNTSNKLDDDNLNFFWDDASNRLGIATGLPGATLDVGGDVIIDDDLTVDTNTLYVDSTNNRVGIGTAIPSQLFEVNGISSLIGTVKVGTGQGNALTEYYNYGTGMSINVNPSQDQAWIGVGTEAGRQINIQDINNRFKDNDHPLQTNPTLFIHSATSPDADNTQWLSLTHDQTDGIISVGSGDIRCDNNVDVNSTGGIKVPVGTTAQRVATQGMIRYNTTTSKFEGYTGAAWVNFH